MIKEKYIAVGIMSGTSLDGVDLALIEFETKNKLSFKILNAKTIQYSAEWKAKINNAPHLSNYHFIGLHKDYGVYLGSLINSFLAEIGIRPDFIASHGHTIYHEPDKKFNFQLGDGAFIASTTGITTVSDFRTLDIALGGQGAPLVPIGDELLFGEYNYCLNIGGIANISYSKNKKRIAFDVCPSNMVLNNLAQRLGYEYDPNGMNAQQGKINTELLDSLNKLSYYFLKAPKSLGREWVESNFIPIIDKYKCSVQDKLATVCEHIAFQLALVVKNKGKMLITGGGAFNSFLISRIKEYSKAEIIIPNDQIVKYKEALIFALLGLLRFNGMTNTLASVTGAKHNVCSGVVHQIYT